MADWCEMGIVNVNVNVFGIKLGIGYRRFEGKRWLIAGLEGTPIKKKKKKGTEGSKTSMVVQVVTRGCPAYIAFKFASARYLHIM